MTPVQGDDHTSPKAFCEDDDRRIDSAQGKIGVLIDQGTNSPPVGRFGRPDIELSESRHELGFHCRT